MHFLLRINERFSDQRDGTWQHTHKDRLASSKTRPDVLVEVADLLPTLKSHRMSVTILQADSHADDFKPWLTMTLGAAR